MVSSIARGTPSAIPDAEPKLVVMSLRTMPLCVSTLTPLEPSAGYGPPVSSGISDAVPDAVVAPPVEAVVIAAAVLAVLPGEVLDDAPQPTRVARPPTARSCSARRRLMSVDRSSERPRS